jgi:hypothetical protein
LSASAHRKCRLNDSHVELDVQFAVHLNVPEKELYTEMKKDSERTGFWEIIISMLQCKNDLFVKMTTMAKNYLKIQSLSN